MLLVLGIGFGLPAGLREPSAGTPWLIAGGFATAAALGYLICLTLLGNAGAPDGAAVRLPLWQMAVALGLAVPAGALGRLLAGPAPRPTEQAEGEAPGSTFRVRRPPAGHAPSVHRRWSRWASWCAVAGSSASSAARCSPASCSC
ncbi:hypothetical protein PQR15_07730 [Streptomyces lydicus]|nr:hypothetical protein [Streptomyces lydicus]